MSAARTGREPGPDPGRGPEAAAAHAATGAEPRSVPGDLDVITRLSRRNSVYRRMTAVCDRVADAALRGAGAAELASVFSQMIGKTVVLLDPDLRLHTRASGGRPASGKPGAGEPGDSEPGDSEPGDSELGDKEPGDSGPGDSGPGDSGPGDSGPGDEGLPWDPREASIARLLAALAAERRPLRVPPVPGTALAHGCLAMPVTVGDTALGYLLVLDETGAADPDDADLIITSYAATLFALTLAREQTTLELGLRYQGTVVDSLVCGHFLDRHDARSKALELGVAESQPFRVTVARVRDGQTAPEASGPAGHGPAERLMTRLALSARWPVVVRGSELVMIVPEPQQPPRRTARDRGGPETGAAVLAGLLRDRSAGPELTCGMSEPTLQPELAPNALRQAEQAIELGTRLGRAGEVIRYEDLGIYRLLLQIGDMHQLWQFAEDVLGPLIDYGATHKVDLISTLSTYLGQHESLKQTARVLRVHVNTVSYRIQRIGQLTSLDLSDPDDRLVAHVAVKIIESQRAGDGLGGRQIPARAPQHTA